LGWVIDMKKRGMVTRHTDLLMNQRIGWNKDLFWFVLCILCYHCPKPNATCNKDWMS